MPGRSAKLLVAGGILLSATLAAVPTRIAHAFILPAEAILSGMANRRAQLEFTTLIVEGFRTRNVQGGEQEQEKLWEAILPDKGHRAEITGPKGKQVVLTIGRKRFVYKEGERTPQVEKISGDVVATFLATVEKDPGGKRGSAFLDAQGIDSTIVSLARMNGRIAYVIGAKPWETTKPQLWIDKGYLAPIRLITVNPKTKSITDLKLLEYGSAQTGDWYPRKIELWRDGQLVETTTYTQASLNEPLDEALFRAPS